MKLQKPALQLRNPWLALLLISDFFFIFLTWLTGPRGFASIALVIVLFTVLSALIGYRIDKKKQKKQLTAMEALFQNPSVNDETKQKLLATVDEFWHPIIESVSEKLVEQSDCIKHKQRELYDYQEYIEAWTHEIKTPLSLATLVLANHQEDMSPYVYRRMEHVRHSITSGVERILYFARLQSDHPDYIFMKFDLSACARKCLEEFLPIADEKKISVQTELFPVQVLSDKKVLSFILSQLLSNAFQYAAAENGHVTLSIRSQAQEDQQICLAIRNNGRGVPAEDRPFLFDKGFTGNHPDRQKATGMGLYLVKKYAEALSIKLSIQTPLSSGQGFSIQLIFPKVT